MHSCCSLHKHRCLCYLHSCCSLHKHRCLDLLFDLHRPLLHAQLLSPENSPLPILSAQAPVAHTGSHKNKQGTVVHTVAVACTITAAYFSSNSSSLVQHNYCSLNQQPVITAAACTGTFVHTGIFAHTGNLFHEHLSSNAPAASPALLSL